MLMSAPEQSLAGRLGLRPKDELISLNDKLLLDAAGAKQAYDDGLARRQFRLVVKREGQQHLLRYRIDLGGSRVAPCSR